MTNPTLYTILEAAEVLKVSHYTISKWLHQRKLPRYKVGRRTFIGHDDLMALVKKEEP